MRRLLAGLVVVLVACAGCTSDSDPADPRPTASPAATAVEPASVTLASLDLDWPQAQGTLDPGEPPATPDGFDDAMLARMASILAAWARATTVDDDVWHDAKPVGAVAAALPDEVADTLRDQTEDVVSPRLAVANVFADDVTVLGSPLVTTAWKVSTSKDDAGKPFVVLELQTRAAYEVRLGSDGPSRVIGMLRVHGLTAYADTTDDFGVTGGWQEFGAGDCALALDDELLPDSDTDLAATDLTRFIAVGDGPKLVMPPLESDENVDEDYLQRCRDGSV